MQNLTRVLRTAHAPVVLLLLGDFENIVTQNMFFSFLLILIIYFLEDCGNFEFNFRLEIINCYNITVNH